jgi:hypothetical protein
MESLFTAQSTRSSKKTYNCSGCCFWHGISAFERYHSFWFEVRQFACQFKGSPTTHMQGNVRRNPSLYPSFIFLLSSGSFDSTSSMLFIFQKSSSQLYSLHILYQSVVSFIYVCYLFSRLEILDCQKSKGIRSYLVVCVEPFHGWHRSYWMATATESLRRLALY